MGVAASTDPRKAPGLRQHLKDIALVVAGVALVTYVGVRVPFLGGCFLWLTAAATWARWQEKRLESRFPLDRPLPCVCLGGGWVPTGLTHVIVDERRVTLGGTYLGEVRAVRLLKGPFKEDALWKAVVGVVVGDALLGDAGAVLGALVGFGGRQPPRVALIPVDGSDPIFLAPPAGMSAKALQQRLEKLLKGHRSATA